MREGSGPKPAAISGGKIVMLLLFISVLVCTAASPMLHAGWFSSHEDRDPLYRVIALSHEIRCGYLYPRWVSAAFYGQGLPIFNYYAPVFYLTAAYLHVLGLSAALSLKLLCGALFLVGALGMFFWVRRHCTETGAAISAVLYLFAPYHFMDIYIRGALSEFAAISALPFLFYGIDLSLSKRAGAGIMITAFSATFIITSHNLSALMVLPFAAAYLLFGIYEYRPGWRTVSGALLGPIMGLGLSAFYWFPVLRERGYVKLNVLTDGYYNYSLHFLKPLDWFLTNGRSPIEEDARMVFHLGLPLLLAIIVSTAALIFQKANRRFAIFALFLGCVAVFLTISPSSFIFKLFPILHFVQFPWRFLGPATLFLSAFAGFVGNMAFKPLKPAVMLGLIVALCIGFSTGDRMVSGRLSLGQEASDRDSIFLRTVGPLCRQDEYVPRWVPGRLYSKSLLPTASFAATKISAVHDQGSRIYFETMGETESMILIPKFFFPGWKAEVDGLTVQVLPDKFGFLTLNVPPGAHTVRIWFGTTAPRILGWTVSAISLALMIIVSLRTMLPRIVLPGKRGDQGSGQKREIDSKS